MRLNQVTQSVSDLLRSIAFYRSLGLQLIVHDNDHYARFACPDGDSTFSLHLADDVRPSGTVVYFECDDLDEQVTRLRSIGVEIGDAIEQSWGWREAALVDPDGHPIILFRAGSYRLDPPWKLR
jgi:catechol 2,3-dioxygenase-like lactoylglutathione lyase family enzyme